MKLSQIRLLSWGAAILGALASLFYGFKAYQQAKSMRPNSIEPVVFSEVQGGANLTTQKMIEKHRLLTALSFLTKIDVPPPPEPKKVVASNTKAPPPPPPPKPKPKPWDPKLTLVLVSYDDIKGNHLAFVKHENNPSHPYLKGEKLPGNSIIKEIFRQSILVKSSDGKQQKQIYTANAIIQNVQRTNLAPPSKNSRVNLPTANGKTKSVAAVAKTRRVPRSRSVDINKNYGISVVEYDATPEGEKRYAISEKDLKALQNQSLRLMSEVFMQPAYNESGDPKGIQLDFVADEPLAKSYGIKNGDILTHVDGKQVTNTYEAENLYNNISSKTRRVQLSIERNGSPLNIWFEMDDFPGTPNRK